MHGVCENKKHGERAFSVKALASILSVFPSKEENTMLFFVQAVNLHQNWSLHLSLWIPYCIKLSGLRDPQGYCFHTS